MPLPTENLYLRECFRNVHDAITDDAIRVVGDLHEESQRSEITRQLHDLKWHIGEWFEDTRSKSRQTKVEEAVRKFDPLLKGLNEKNGNPDLGRLYRNVHAALDEIQHGASNAQWRSH